MILVAAILCIAVIAWNTCSYSVSLFSIVAGLKLPPLQLLLAIVAL